MRILLIVALDPSQSIQKNIKTNNIVLIILVIEGFIDLSARLQYNCIRIDKIRTKTTKLKLKEGRRAKTQPISARTHC